MYLGPLGMDYTGAVAKETRYIVSLDRLVKKQHIWGFHQDNFVFRKLEPPDLLQSCPSCGAGPIKWSAIRNKRHNSRVSRLRCNRQAKGTCDYRGALRRTERKRMLRNPAASDSAISSQPVEEAFTMLSEAMQLLQMADKPTLRSYVSDSLPKPIRRFINQFLVLEDPKDLVFHRMSATNNSHIHDPNKHSFIRAYMTPADGIRSDNLAFDQHRPPVPILPPPSLPATHERPSLEQHLQHLRREEQQYLQPRRSLPGDSRLAPHLQSNQPLRRESRQQLRQEDHLQSHQLLRREPRLQPHQLLPGDSRPQPLLQDALQKMLQPESQQQQLRRETHLRSQTPADSRQKPHQVVSQDPQQEPRQQSRREADIQSQHQLSQPSNQQQPNESNQQPNSQPKPQLQQQLRQIPKQEPPQQPRRQPCETQPHSSWAPSAVSTRAGPVPMRPRGGIFFPPRGTGRYGSGVALNGRRPKAMSNMNSSMTLGMIPRLQQMPAKIARGMVPSLVPTMVPRMVPRSVPRNAADNGPTMRSNINHRAAPWHPRAPVNGDWPQSAASMPSHSDVSSKFKAPPPPPSKSSSSQLPSNETTPKKKASALDQLAFEASRTTTATSRPSNKRNLGELKDLDKTDVDLEPPRALTKTEKDASAAVQTSTSGTATQNTPTKVTVVKQLELSDKKNPAGAVMCPCCFKMIVPTDKRFCMSCGTNLKPTTITI